MMGTVNKNSFPIVSTYDECVHHCMITAGCEVIHFATGNTTCYFGADQTQISKIVVPNAFQLATVPVLQVTAVSPTNLTAIEEVVFLLEKGNFQIFRLIKFFSILDWLH